MNGHWRCPYTGVCNIGCRPTFDGGADTIEVHLSGFEGDMYGETLDIVFHGRLRDKMAFESPERLVEQIRKDLEKARRGVFHLTRYSRMWYTEPISVEVQKASRFDR